MPPGSSVTATSARREPRAALVVCDPVDDLDRVGDAELARTLGDQLRGARRRHERVGAASAPELGRRRRRRRRARGPRPRRGRPDRASPRARPARRGGGGRESRRGAPDRSASVGPNGTVRNMRARAGSSSISSGRTAPVASIIPSVRSRWRACAQSTRSAEARRRASTADSSASTRRRRVGALVLVDDEVLEQEGAGGVDHQVLRLREHGVALEQEAGDDHRRAALDEAADVVERERGRSPRARGSPGVRRGRPRGRARRGRGRGRRRAGRGLREPRCRPRRCKLRPQQPSLSHRVPRGHRIQ